MVRTKTLLIPAAIGISDALFKPNPLLWVGVTLAVSLYNGRFEPYAEATKIGAMAIVGREAMRRLW